MAVINELRGRILQCFCFPWPCHGDILAELANGSETTKEATSPRIEKISIHDLTLNDRCQSRGALNQDTVKDYARLYEEAPEVSARSEKVVRKAWCR